MLQGQPIDIESSLRPDKSDPSLILFSKVQKTGSTTLTYLLSQFLNKTKLGYRVHKLKQGPMEVETKEQWVRCWHNFFIAR